MRILSTATPTIGATSVTSECDTPQVARDSTPVIPIDQRAAPCGFMKASPPLPPSRALIASPPCKGVYYTTILSYRIVIVIKDI